MLDKEQGSRLICVCVSDSLSVSLPPSLQAVSEDQQPKGKKGKEEKSKGNAKPQNKFAALDDEEEEEEEEIIKEKEPPKQGKEKAKKAEQVCILVSGEGGLRD